MKVSFGTRWKLGWGPALRSAARCRVPLLVLLLLLFFIVNVIVSDSDRGGSRISTGNSGSNSDIT